MPQLNVLPVNVLQNIELKDESTSFNSIASKDDFSKYIDLHLAKNKETDSHSKGDATESESIGVKNSRLSTESMLDTKKAGDLVENADASDEIDSSTIEQKVAASGNKGQLKSNEIDEKALLESEKLMSFLSKADNTLVNQSIDTASFTSSQEQLSVEQKAHYEAQLLLNSSNLVADLSAVAKALDKGQVDVTLAPTLAVQAVSKESVNVKLPIDSPIEGKNKGNKQAEVPLALVKSVKNTTVLSELDTEANTEAKTEANTEVKISHASSDKMNTVLSGLKAESATDAKVNTMQQGPNQGLSTKSLVDRELASKNNKEAFLAADQKESIQSRKAEALSGGQLSENDDENENMATSHASRQNQAQSDSVKSLEQTIETQINGSKQIKSDKNSSFFDPQMAKNELTQNSETTKPIEKTNQTVDHFTKQTLPSNQSVTNDLIQDDVSKTQAKQFDKAQLSASLAEQSQEKSADHNKDEILVERKVPGSVKRESLVNGHFIDVNGKATQTPQHIIEQQSAEFLNPSVATEVTQSQKTNTQLHQETISLFRKDFTEAVKDKVMLMISQKLQQFDITLDPPELGNMQVRVNLQGEQAVVSFLVQSQQTKDALEQNMHKLRELLAEQGVDVGDANVEQQSQQSSNEEGFTNGNNNQMEGEVDSMADANDVVAHTLSAQMIDSSTTSVDYYA